MKLVIRVALVFAIVVAAWHLGQAQSAVADFRVTVEPSARGAKLECLKGCTWKTLNFSCDSKASPCKGQVDQSGVSSAAK